MASFVLADAAKRDLHGIADYTLERWGTDQADVYIDTLFEAFERIARHPDFGRIRQDIAPGLRSMASGKHLIFYRIETDSIGIARILHVRQDPAQHI